MSCNVVSNYVSFCRKCNIRYMKFFMNRYYNRDIFMEFYDVYEKVRYYNLFSLKQKGFVSNINYYLKSKCDSLLENMDSPKDIIIIKDTFYFFKYIMYFDGVKRLEMDYNEVLDSLINDMFLRYSNIDIKVCKKEFNLMYKDDIERKNKYLLEFDTKDFELVFRRCNIKGVYDVKLEDNIKIPRLYSEFAIEKVRNSEIIREDMLNVCLYLISKNILINIINGIFDKEYLVDFDIGISDKVDKFKRLLQIIDNDISKEFICFKINYSDFNLNKDKIYELMREVFKFSVCIFDSDSIDEIEYKKLGVFKYIIVLENDLRVSKLDNVIIRK